MQLIVRPPKIVDWYDREPLYGVSTTTSPWDELPKKWPLFAERTQVASGGKFVPFVPFDFQIDLARIKRKVQNVYVLKSRQTGISETIISTMLHPAVRKPAWTGVIFSKTGDDASELAARIKGQAASLRDQCPPFDKDSMRKLVFRGRGSLHFLPPTERAARGIPSASELLFDEAAFIEKLKGIEQGALPTTSMLGDAARHIWVTTPKGRSGTFSDHWHEDHGEVVVDPTPMGKNGIPRLRISPDNQYAKVCVHWSQHPFYNADPDWAEKTRRKRQLTRQQWDSEYELDFTASDSEVYSHELVALAEEAGHWESPYRQNIYVLGIDPNGGGGDAFCGIVVDVSSTPWHAVAGFHVAGRSRDYGLRHCARLIDEFSPQLVTVEKNGVGAAVAEGLALLRPGITIEEVATSRPSKIMMTDRIVLLLEQQALTIPPTINSHWEGESLGEQLKNFRQAEDGNRAAAPGHRDDGVMALAMACQAGATIRPMQGAWISMV
jgi:hypothetical protein